jgi:hypothetical protein
MNELQKILAFEYRSDGDFSEVWRITSFPYEIQNGNFSIEFE